MKERKTMKTRFRYQKATLFVFGANTDQIEIPQVLRSSTRSAQHRGLEGHFFPLDTSKGQILIKTEGSTLTD